MGVPEKIKKIEEDLLKTQINKHTERHIGVLRAKLSKLKMEQEEQQARRSGSAVGYDVKKSGDGTVVSRVRCTDLPAGRIRHQRRRLPPLPRPRGLERLIALPLI